MHLKTITLHIFKMKLLFYSVVLHDSQFETTCTYRFCGVKSVEVPRLNLGGSHKKGICRINAVTKRSENACLSVFQLPQKSKKIINHLCGGESVDIFLIAFLHNSLFAVGLDSI